MYLKLAVQNVSNTPSSSLFNTFHPLIKASENVSMFIRALKVASSLGSIRFEIHLQYLSTVCAKTIISVAMTAWVVFFTSWGLTCCEKQCVIQWKPAIAKCHGTEKNVAGSSL